MPKVLVSGNTVQCQCGSWTFGIVPVECRGNAATLFF